MRVPTVTPRVRVQRVTDFRRFPLTGQSFQKRVDVRLGEGSGLLDDGVAQNPSRCSGWCWFLFRQPSSQM